MIKIGNKPIIEHIINIYFKYGVKKIIIAAGYKFKIIKSHFKKNKKVIVVNTGLNSLTGLRIKKLSKIIGNKKFFLTYGDGLSNINIKKLLKAHNKSKKIATMTIVHPPARFGEVIYKKNLIFYFSCNHNFKKDGLMVAFLFLSQVF